MLNHINYNFQNIFQENKTFEILKNHKFYFQIKRVKNVGKANPKLNLT